MPGIGDHGGDVALAQVTLDVEGLGAGAQVNAADVTHAHRVAEETLGTGAGAARAGFEVIAQIVGGNWPRGRGIIDVDHFDGEVVGAVAVARCGAAFGHWQGWVVAIRKKIQLLNTEMYIWVFLSANANTNGNTFEKCIKKY